MMPPSPSSPARREQRPGTRAPQPDLLRASYNLATAYTNYAYLPSPPRLTHVGNTEEALKRADKLCRDILFAVRPAAQPPRDQRMHEEEPKKKTQSPMNAETKGISPALKDNFLVPTVILLAGIRTLRHRPSDAPYASPRSLFLTAMDQPNHSASLHSLLCDEAASGDALLLWLGAGRHSLTPRAAYNLGCYRVATGELDQALNDLAMAAADIEIKKWALGDPALGTLRTDRHQEFYQLFPAPREGQSPDVQPSRAEPVQTVHKVELNWGSHTLITDSPEERNQLQKKMSSSSGTIVWSARRMIRLHESTAIARLDVWATGDDHKTSFHFELSASERIRSTFEARVEVDDSEPTVCTLVPPSNARVEVPRFVYERDRQLASPWLRGQRCKIEIREIKEALSFAHVLHAFEY